MFKKIKLYILLFCAAPTISFANIKIKDWNQTTEFTSYGRKVDLTIKAIVEAKENYYYNSWTYILDNKYSYEVLNPENKNINNNKIQFNFKDSFNGDEITMKLQYKQYNKDLKNVKYIRSEYIGLAKFAANANVNLKVLIPEDLVVYSLHPDFKSYGGNIFTWSGKAPSEGLNEIFYMTYLKARWRAKIITYFQDIRGFSEAIIETPQFFKGGNQNILNYRINSNLEYTSTKPENKEYLAFKFKSDKMTKAEIEIEAIIDNGTNNYYWVSELSPNDYITISNEEQMVLSEIISEVRNSPNPYNYPLYIRLAQWVHNYIKYDISFLGKDLSVNEIISGKRGVCVQYAVLYEKLIRASGLAATSVAGISYDIENKKFENHAWVLINVNNSWIPIDPTWGVYSGILPVSHIFTYRKLNTPVIFRGILGLGNTNQSKTDILNKIEFLE